MSRYIITLNCFTCIAISCNLIEIDPLHTRCLCGDFVVAFLLTDDIKIIEKEVADYDNSDFNYLTIYEKS